MNPTDVQTTHIFTVDAVKVYSVIGNETRFIEQGPLNVLFLFPYNIHVLQVGTTFSYSLAEDIPVLAMIPKHSTSYPKYILPSLQGNYIIKVCKGVGQEALSNLETIFNNNCSLIYKQESLVTEGYLTGTSFTPDTGYPVTSGSSYPITPGSKTQKVSNVIRMGGEYSKVGIMKVAEIFATGLRGLSGLVGANCKRNRDIDPSEVVINNLRRADETTAMFAGITQVQAEKLISNAKTIAWDVAQKAQGKDLYKQFESYEHSGKITKVGKSLVSAFGDIYDGVLEGLTIIGREIGDSSTLVAATTCGPRAGEVTRQSANVVGNVGLTAVVIQKEVIKALQDLAVDEEQALVDI